MMNMSSVCEWGGHAASAVDHLVQWAGETSRFSEDQVGSSRKWTKGCCVAFSLPEVIESLSEFIDSLSNFSAVSWDNLADRFRKAGGGVFRTFEDLGSVGLVNLGKYQETVEYSAAWIGVADAALDDFGGRMYERVTLHTAIKASSAYLGLFLSVATIVSAHSSRAIFTSRTMLTCSTAALVFAMADSVCDEIEDGSSCGSSCASSDFSDRGADIDAKPQKGGASLLSVVSDNEGL